MALDDALVEDGREPAGERSSPASAEPEGARADLKRQVDTWLVRHGTPRLGDYSARDVTPVLWAPLIALLVFETAAVPWFELDPLVDSFWSPEAEEWQRDLYMKPLALVAVLAALGIALTFPRRLLHAAAGFEPLLYEGADQRVSRRRSCARFAGRVLFALAPLALVIVWLSRADALGNVDVGWFDAATLLVVALAAVRVWRRGAGFGTTVTAAVLIVIVTYADSIDDFPFPVEAVVFAFAVAATWVGGTKRQHGVYAALLLTVLAFQTAVAPYLRSDTSLAWAASHLAGPVLVALVFISFVRLAGGEERARDGLAGTHRLPKRAVVPVAATFVLGPPMLTMAVQNESARDFESAVTMAFVNALVLVALVAGASFGVQAVSHWARGELRDQVRRAREIIIDGGPLVFVFIFVILFTSEIWHLAGRLSLPRFVALVLALLAIGVIVLLLKVAGEVKRDVTLFDDWEAVETAVKSIEGDDAREVTVLVDERPAAPVYRFKLTRAQHANLAIVSAVRWAIPMLFVALAVGLVIFVIALVAVSGGLLADWQVDQHGRSAAALGGRVAAFIGAFSAIYFVVEMMREEKLNARPVADMERVKRRLAVRAAYLSNFPETEDPDAGRERPAIDGT